MTDERKDDFDLDALFAEARGQKADVSADLMARILADAETAMPRPEIGAARPSAGPGGALRSLWLALGGWTGAGGLAAAAAVGLWLGIAPPAVLDGVATLVFGETVSVSILSADNYLGTEG